MREERCVKFQEGGEGIGGSCGTDEGGFEGVQESGLEVCDL